MRHDDVRKDDDGLVTPLGASYSISRWCASITVLRISGLFSVARSQEVTKWQAMNTGRTEEGYARCGMPKCAKASNLSQMGVASFLEHVMLLRAGFLGERTV